MELAIRRHSSIMVRELIAAGCSRAPILNLLPELTHLPSDLCHLVNPFQYSIVWSSTLHRRFPYEEQQIATTVVRMNYKAHLDRQTGWLYVPSHLLVHIVQYALWLF